MTNTEFDTDKFTQFAQKYYQLDDSVQELMDEYGFEEKLGVGSCRTAFAIDENHVLKVARNSFYGDGKEDNKYAISTWKQASPEQKELIVPFVDWEEDNFLWIIQKRATPRTEELEREKFTEKGILVSDNPHGNVMKYNGEQRVVDIGEGVKLKN